MSSIVRRASSKLAKFLERAADPGGVTDTVQVYGKDVTGVTQLFAQNSAGTVYQLTPTSANTERTMINEIWTQNDVAASQTNVDLFSQSSQLFDTWKTIRAGSIVGLATRFTTAVTAGTATVTVTINGTAGTAAVVSTNASNQSGGVFTQATGIDTFVASDLLGLRLTTSGTFAPTTTDLEAYMEIDIT